MGTTTTNHYDLIVLGSDIAGLVAAALVARRGKRVLVMPHGHVDGCYRLGGRTLPLDVSPVVHMGTPPAKRVFQELGQLQQLRRQHTNVNELLHVVLPGHRLDLEPASRNFALEVHREWPDAPAEEARSLQRRWIEATDEVLDQLLGADSALMADGFWQRRFLSRVESQLPRADVDELQPLPFDHPLRRAARAVEPWLQHLSPAQLGKAASLRLAGLWNEGPEDLPRGYLGLREVLLQRIELHSGEVKRGLRIAEILTRRGRVIGVSLLGKRDRYGCDNLIVAMDPRRLLDGTLQPEQLPKPLLQTLSTIVPVAHRYVLHLEVEERGLSPALEGMVICIPSPETSGSDPEAARAWAEHGVGHSYVRLLPGGGEDLRRVCVTRIVADGEPLDDMRERIIEELDTRGVLPFCRPYLRFVHSPHDNREASDGSGEPLADVGPGSRMQLPMAPLYIVHGEPSLGVGVLPHHSGIKALHFASRLTLPGLGLEGEFAAGTMAANLVANPARSPFSRSPLLSRA